MVNFGAPPMNNVTTTVLKIGPPAIVIALVQAVMLFVILVQQALPAEVSSSSALTAAAADFHNLCAPCHGRSARGDGPVGRVMTTKPADLTTIAKRHSGTFPDELIYEKIEGLDMPLSHGTLQMPIWGDVFLNEAVGKSTSTNEAKKAETKVERRIKYLVEYLKTIQTAE
jgi:hypothetical protein